MYLLVRGKVLLYILIVVDVCVCGCVCMYLYLCSDSNFLIV